MPENAERNMGTQSHISREMADAAVAEAV